MARARLTLESMTGTAALFWSGRADFGSTFSADGSQIWLTQLILPGSPDFNTVALTFTGELANRVETGTWTFTGPGSGAAPATLTMLPDRTNPYQWQTPVSGDLHALFSAIADLPVRDRVLIIEVYDGVDDGPLALPTLPALTAQVGIPFAYEFPAAIGGVAPYRYSLEHTLENMEFDPDTRTLSGSPRATDIGENHVVYQANSGTEILRQTVSFAISPDPRPIFRVEVDWDGDGNFGNDRSDITADVLSISACRRGREFVGQRYGQSIAGLFACRLTDDDAIYDRFNPSSPLAGKVLPGREVRVSQLVDGAYSTEWSGVLDDVRPTQLSGRRVVRLRALGALSLLRNTLIHIPMEERITGATAARRILDASGIAARWIGSLSSGTRLQRWWVRGETGLDALRTLAESVLGIVVEERDGTIALEARTTREAQSAPALVLASETPAASETPITALSWADPLYHLATSVVVALREFDVAPTQVLWTWEGAPIRLPAGASISVQAPYPPPDRLGTAIAVDTWAAVDPNQDISANTESDGTGADAGEDVVLGVVDSANLRVMTIRNTAATAVHITALQARGDPLLVSGVYERRFEDASAIAQYGDRPYVADNTFLVEAEAEAYARRLLTALARPLPRVRVTYEDSEQQTRLQISDTVLLRSAGRSSRYYVEMIDHEWQRGGLHLVTLTMTERSGLVEAIAPSVTVAPIPAADEGSVTQLAATVHGGAYDAITYAWTVSHGALSAATVANPTWTRPQVDEDTVAEIQLRVSVTGSGNAARRGTTAMRDVNLQSLIRDVPLLPVAVAPTVTVDAVANGRSGAASLLEATITGGVYDALTYAWTVSGGELDDAAAASPTWTRPTVNADTDYTIGVVVTARGTGTIARADTSAAADRATRTATVVPPLPVAAAPTVAVDAVANGLGGTRVALEATITGGVYDALTYAWTVSGGELDDAAAASPTWTRPTVDADTDYTIGVVVTARGTGTIARADTSAAADRATRTATVTPLLPVAAAPTVAVDAVANGLGGTRVALEATITGGVYDALTYAWTVSGGELDDAAAASPTWTRPTVDADTDYTIGVVVTARGTGTIARADTSAAADRATRTATVTPLPVTTMDTDTIYQLAAAQPTAPAGGTTDEDHLPTGWSRTAPAATQAADVWQSQRTRTFEDGVFASAGAWGTPSIHERRLPVGCQTWGAWSQWSTWERGPTGAPVVQGRRFLRYEGSCADRVAVWEQFGQLEGLESRLRSRACADSGNTEVEEQGESRPYTVPYTAELRLPSAESGTWSAWANSGSPTTSDGPETLTGYEGSCAGRQAIYAWLRTTSQPQRRTHSCTGAVQTQTLMTRQTLVRRQAAPDPGTWSPWVCGPWIGDFPSYRI